MPSQEFFKIALDKLEKMAEAELLDDTEVLEIAFRGGLIFGKVGDEQTKLTWKPLKIAAPEKF